MNRRFFIIGVPVVLIVAVSAVTFMSGQNQKAQTMVQVKQGATGEDFMVIMNKLSENLESWSSLSVVDKVRAVSAIMGLYTSQNKVAFKNPPEFYAASVDNAVASDQMRRLPLDKAIMVLAVMEYDFDKEGKDKDELAREILGDALYEQNKARLAERAGQQ